MYDEDVVEADGTGAAYDQVIEAVESHEVTEVAIMGYSHGGGSTHDLAEALQPQGYPIPFTAYVDAVENDTDGDVEQERRRPPGSAFHMNFFQHGQGNPFQPGFDGGLDGGPIQNPQAGDFELDVETTPWGAGATHLTVDDLNQIHTQIEQQLRQSVNR